jgi:DnaJ-class molecular chaperone
MPKLPDRTKVIDMNFTHSPNACIACEGSGLKSKGGQCPICKGSGKRRTNVVHVIGKKLVIKKP